MAILALVFVSRTLESLYMFKITAFVTPVITPQNLPRINCFLVSKFFFLYGACYWLASFEYPMFLDLVFLNCFCFDLFGGISVLWYLNKFTWMACGSLDTCLMCLVVDLEDSHFLASCLTLLAGNISRSMLESLIILETNSSFLRKKPKYVSMQVLLFQVGTLLGWSELVQQYPFHLHSSLLAQYFVKRSNLALTSFVCGLQNSLNLDQMTSKHNSSGGQAPGYILVYSKISWPGHNVLAVSCFCKHSKFTFQYIFTF